jgi:hypothetical protein
MKYYCEMKFPAVVILVFVEVDILEYQVHEIKFTGLKLFPVIEIRYIAVFSLI